LEQEVRREDRASQKGGKGSLVAGYEDGRNRLKEDGRNLSTIRMLGLR
jgi:hypothetical protein